MAESTSQESLSKPQESLSQLIARILDQLSVSAWLPAGALVFIVLFYANLRVNNGDPVSAMRAISSMGWGSLILVIGAIVLATMISQAFEFEAIRLLEGYWGTWWLASRLTDLGCAMHIRRRERLAKRKKELEERAFERARTQMCVDPRLRLFADILHASRTGGPVPAHASPEDIKAARRHGWFSDARPGDIRRLFELSHRLERDYPAKRYRVLPTRLGNVLRAHEDRIYKPDSGSLEGMVQRVFHELPEALQMEHDQFRSRLDLYCSMVIVFVLAGVAALLVLGWSDWRPASLTAAIAVVMSLLCYRAAIASARAYGTVLESIESLERSGKVGRSPAPAPTPAAATPTPPTPPAP